MSTTSYREFNSGIKRGLIGKAYLFSGRDTDRKRKAISEVEAALRKRFNGILSAFRYRSNETTAEEFATHLFNPPLFEDNRLIVIPEIMDLDKTSRDLLREFMETSPPGGVFIVASTGMTSREIARKGKAVAEVVRRFTIVEFSPPREDEMESRARDLAKELGFRIETEALRRVLIMTGGDFGLIRHEMEKLALFVPQGGMVGQREVGEVISRGGDVDVWALAEAIVDGDAAGTQRILHRLLLSGEKPVQVIGALWYTMSRLAWCRSLLDSGMDEAQIGSRMKIRPWMLKKYISRARRFNGGEYTRILNILFDLDVASRSRGGDVEPIFSMGLAEMVAHRQGERR